MSNFLGAYQNKCAYLPKCLHVSMNVSTRTCRLCNGLIILFDVGTFSRYSDFKQLDEKSYYKNTSD